MKSSHSVRPLTPKEKVVLEFIETYIENQGYSPSFSEIQKHFQFASLNSVQNYVRQLVNKEYLYNPGQNQKRALQVTKPSHYVPSQLKQTRNPNTVQYKIPLLGMVAAGAPIERMTYDESIEIPQSMVRRPEKTYALQVQGQSMIDDGIHDGDTILVQRQSHADNGNIVVAVVDHEATVKRFFRSQKKKNWVELRPANTKMESFWYPAQEVDIRGIVVGLIRKYI